jgi:hypothetical protein
VICFPHVSVQKTAGIFAWPIGENSTTAGTEDLMDKGTASLPTAQ